MVWVELVGQRESLINSWKIKSRWDRIDWKLREKQKFKEVVFLLFFIIKEIFVFKELIKIGKLFCKEI